MICPKTLGNFGVETLHCDVNSSRVTRQDARAFLRPAHTTDDPSVERFRNTCQQMFVEFSRAVSSSSTARVSVKKNTLDVGERATGQRD